MLYRSYYQSTGPAAESSLTYAQTVLSLSPTAYWRCGEASGTLADSSTNGLDMDSVAGLTYGQTGWASDGGDAVTISGSGSYAYQADDDAFDIGTGDFSVVWAMDVAVDSWSVIRRIITHRYTNLGSWSVYLRANADDLGISLYDKTSGSGSYAISTGADELDPGGMVWCAVTADRSGNATLYVDGNTTSYTASISAGSSYDCTNTESCYIGTHNTSGGTSLNGDICEVAYWKGTVLTSTQVGTLYAAR